MDILRAYPQKNETFWDNQKLLKKKRRNIHTKRHKQSQGETTHKRQRVRKNQDKTQTYHNGSRIFSTS